MSGATTLTALRQAMTEFLAGEGIQALTADEPVASHEHHPVIHAVETSLREGPACGRSLNPVGDHAGDMGVEDILPLPGDPKIRMMAEKTQPGTASGADEFLIAGGVRCEDEPEEGRFTSVRAVCPVIEAIHVEGEVADRYGRCRPRPRPGSP